MKRRIILTVTAITVFITSATVAFAGEGDIKETATGDISPIRIVVALMIAAAAAAIIIFLRRRDRKQ